MRLVLGVTLTLAALLGSLGHLARAAGDGWPVLTVTTLDEEVLVRVTLPPEATWSIAWTHSVAQVQIVDQFAWRDGIMYVTDQYTPYLDIAGLGGFAGRGEVLDVSTGGYHLANIDFPLYGNVHDLIIGSERAPTVLIVGTHRFELSRTHPATHARIEVSTR